MSAPKPHSPRTTVELALLRSKLSPAQSSALDKSPFSPSECIPIHEIPGLLCDKVGMSPAAALAIAVSLLGEVDVKPVRVYLLPGIGASRSCAMLELPGTYTVAQALHAFSVKVGIHILGLLEALPLTDSQFVVADINKPLALLRVDEEGDACLTAAFGKDDVKAAVYNAEHSSIFKVTIKCPAVPELNTTLDACAISTFDCLYRKVVDPFYFPPGCARHKLVVEGVGNAVSFTAGACEQFRSAGITQSTSLVWQVAGMEG